jgi:glycosyltransferase involved in cell wall biosynthesis
VAGRRIVFVSSLWPPRVVGGAERYAAALAARLRDAGDEVLAITLAVDGADVVAQVPSVHRLDEHRRAPRWRQLGLHSGDVWRPLRSARRALESLEPDVVHTHVVAGMSVRALTLPSALGVPHVHTLHDHWLRCWRSTAQGCGVACDAIARWRSTLLSRHAPHVVIGISQSILDAHALAGRVVRHPVDDVRLRARRALGDPPTFGFLGQVSPNKGIDVLLRAVPDGARLVVAGRGRLDDEVRAAGVEHRGWVDDAGRDAFFDDIDCLVVPSVWKEPAGLVVLEATAAGVPVIASDIGGLPEYVPAECRHLLTPPGDVTALRRAMERFVEQPVTVDAAALPGWEQHLRAVRDAYDEAERVARG